MAGNITMMSFLKYFILKLKCNMFNFNRLVSSCHFKRSSLPLDSLHILVLRCMLWSDISSCYGKLCFTLGLHVEFSTNKTEVECHIFTQNGKY